VLANPLANSILILIKCGPLVPSRIHPFLASCMGFVLILQNYYSLVLAIYVGYLLECSWVWGLPIKRFPHCLPTLIRKQFSWAGLHPLCKEVEQGLMSVRNRNGPLWQNVKVICSQISCHGGCTSVNEKPIKDWVWGVYIVGSTHCKMGIP
jgi:hypothetical protein